MRVVHLNLERGWRGGERQVALLARELSAAGVRQAVIGRAGEPLLDRVVGIPGLETVPATGRLSALLALRRQPRPTVIHAHTAHAVVLAALGKRPGDVLVATRRLDLPASPFWLRRMDRVIAISRSVEESLVAAGLDRGKVVRIPSGIDCGRTLDPSLRDTLRREIGVSPDGFLGLTVGALEEQKDPLTLVRAMARVPSWRHLWLGDGSLRDEVEREARNLGVAERLILPGYDPEPDRWHGACDFFVFPSRHEGLGTALLDAFHFGLPAVISRIPGTSELLREGETALGFEAGDAEGLAAAVERLLGDMELRERLVAGAGTLVAGYDVRETAKQYLALYEELWGRIKGTPT